MQSTFQSCECYSAVRRFLVRYQLEFSVFNGVSVVFSNRALESGYGVEPIAFGIACDVWVSHETSFANDLTRCNPSLTLEVLLGGNRWLVGTLVTPLFDDSIYIFLLYMYMY